MLFRSDLKGIFKNFQQPGTLAESESVNNGPIILPLMIFAPVFTALKSKANRPTICEARLIVYSKSFGDPRECNRFIHAHRTVTKDEVLELIPASVRDAIITTDETERTLEDIIATLSSLSANKVSYHYSTSVCEATVTHTVSIIHDYIKDDETYCVFTTYITYVGNK